MLEVSFGFKVWFIIDNSLKIFGWFLRFCNVKLIVDYKFFWYILYCEVCIVCVDDVIL